MGGRNSQPGLAVAGGVCGQEPCAWGWCNNPVPFQVEELNKKLTQHEKATRTQQQRVKVSPRGLKAEPELSLASPAALGGHLGSPRAVAVLLGWL